MAVPTHKSSDDAASDQVASTSTAPAKDPQPRNAFTALMSSSHPRSPKRKRSPPPSTPASDPARNTTFLGRDGLGAYIRAPETFPPSRVVYHTDQFVVIHDLWPKSSIHLLVLPRDAAKSSLHPFEAFEDADFLSAVKSEVEKVKALAAKELKRRFGRESKTQQEWERRCEERRNSKAQPEGDGDSEDLEPALAGDDGSGGRGRDYTLDISAGIHAVPSMNHLHIHILSRDRHSPSLRHRKHYNSFSTDFFVPLDAFPLAADDPRRHPGREGYLKQGFKCWRCGRDFGNGFKLLKEHLEGEFAEWKRE